MNILNVFRCCACRRAAGVWLGLLSLFCLVSPALAGGNPCDGAEEPDVIVGDLQAETRWGAVGTTTAFSVGTYSCNIGSCWVNWFQGNNQHPVIAQNMFRFKDGRFEQVGQSWLKHGFFALSNQICNAGCIGTDGTHLGVNCSDPYTATRNGQQNNMGPKSDVNASNGVFPFPATNMGATGNTIFKRIQVKNPDLAPSLNVGAKYFLEGQYVTQDDALAGNQDNNASWRPITVFETAPGSGAYDINLLQTTRREQPAIFAWLENDTNVQIIKADVDGLTTNADGIFWIASKVTSLGGGMWHYEYAIQNLNSNRSASEFRLPILPGAVVANHDFHDVDYHSGEPYNGTDWAKSVDNTVVPNNIVWKTTQTFAENPNANALRWGTLYNFRFDTNTPPVDGQATLVLFKPGTPSSLLVNTQVPALCNTNGACDLGEPVCGCPADCVPPPAELTCGNAVDDDCDGNVDCFDADCCAAEGSACAGFDQDSDLVSICDDCNDTNNLIWTDPSEAQNLIWKQLAGVPTLVWTAPAQPGAQTVHYEVLRTQGPTSFLAPDCMAPINPTQTRLAEPTVPVAGTGYYYLVRATNGCGNGVAGTDSNDVPIPAADCP